MVPCTSFQSNMLKINGFEQHNGDKQLLFCLLLLTIVTEAFAKLAYVWCVCGAAQHKEQEPICSCQDVATQAPAGFSLKSQLETQGKLRYAQVTSPRHGQPPVDGE